MLNYNPASIIANKTPFFYGWIIVFTSSLSMFVRNAAATLTIIFILFVSEAFTDEKDRKDHKRKKITSTDLQNELNGLINKVRMMERDEGENEEEVTRDIPRVPQKDMMDL